MRIAASGDRDLDHPEAHRHRDLLVDAGDPDVGDRGDVLGLAEQHQRELHRVQPDVEQRATSERSREQPVVGIERRAEAERARDHANLTDAPLVDERAQVHIPRKEPGPHRLHEEAALRDGAVGHRDDLLLVDRERLLAEHVLAAVEEQQRVGAMTAVRRADVHDVDLVIRGQRFVRRWRRAIPCASPKRSADSCGTRRDRDHLGIGQPPAVRR